MQMSCNLCGHQDSDYCVKCPYMSNKWKKHNDYTDIQEPDWLTYTLWFLIICAVGIIIYTIFYA
jgi:hypothetical protein